MFSPHVWGMIEQQTKRVAAGERRFEAYLDGIVAALGHGGRAEPARAYCTGLLLPGERKSIEPMAARLEPSRVQAAHQSLHPSDRQSGVERRGGARDGAPARAAVPRAPRSDPHLDCRRHWL